MPEGIEGMVPYKGSLHVLLPQLIGGVRSGMGLAGCATIDELRTEARFVRITAAGLKESHAHDVVITKEAPELLGRALANLSPRPARARPGGRGTRPAPPDGPRRPTCAAAPTAW